jgi:hypothetical protein
VHELLGLDDIGQAVLEDGNWHEKSRCQHGVGNFQGRKTRSLVPR